MKYSFKKQMKDAGSNAGKYVLGTTGAVGAGLAINFKKKDGTSIVAPKWAGTILWVAGLGSSMLNPEQYSNALLQGAGHVGAVYAVAGHAKVQNKYGLSGIEDDDVNGLDWDKMSEEALSENTAGTEDDDDDEPVAGDYQEGDEA